VGSAGVRQRAGASAERGYAGIHLAQGLAPGRPPGPSAVAVLDAAARLVALREAGDDQEIAALVPAGADLAVDAPLAVPNATGRRPIEELLAWCDVPLFPVSRRRLEALHGGVRGERLALRLAHAGRMDEAAPDLVLRELAWEREHAGGALDPLEYRERWLAIRPPVYRPKRGRAKPAGIGPAFDLLAGVIDTGGWRPDPAGGDRDLIAAAAGLDALAAAYAAVRAARPRLGGSVTAGEPGTGRLTFPADVNLARRITGHRDRLAAEGRSAKLPLRITPPDHEDRTGAGDPWPHVQEEPT
jgi:hypothetical protein